MRQRYERRIIFTALLGSAPVAFVALVLVFAGGFPAQVVWLVAVLIAAMTCVVTHRLRTHLDCQLRTLTAIIIAILRRDTRRSWPEIADDGILAEMMSEVSALAGLLEARKVDLVEGAEMLRTVEEILRSRRACLVVRTVATGAPACSSSASVALASDLPPSELVN